MVPGTGTSAVDHMNTQVDLDLGSLIGSSTRVEYLWYSRTDVAIRRYSLSSALFSWVVPIKVTLK